MNDAISSESIFLEKTYVSLWSDMEGEAEKLLVLLKEIEAPELLICFLEGLSEPYERITFFIYGPAVEALSAEACTELRRRFKALRKAGLCVFIAGESCQTAADSDMTCCSMRDLPLLIREADKIVNL